MIKGTRFVHYFPYNIAEPAAYVNNEPTRAIFASRSFKMKTKEEVIKKTEQGGILQPP